MALCTAIPSCAEFTGGEPSEDGPPDAASADGGPGFRIGVLDNCDDLRATPQPSFDAALAEWSAERCVPAGRSGGFPFFVEGACANGGRILYSGNGVSTERRFFDRAGNFEAVQFGSDTSAGCAVASPVPFTCGIAAVTRVVCGSALAVGEEIKY